MLASVVTELVRPVLATVAMAVSFAAAVSAWLSVLSDSMIRVRAASEVRRRRGRI